ncbi:hypothetical protein HFN51_27845 [Rhizobium leguminosarum]|nr:hypothetical protein [Rhizobium leguminosarum]
MLWILKLLQRISRMRRRIVGSKPPHWFKDGLSLVGYLNFLDLMPTLAAIALSPSHFYKRVPQIVSDKFSWYKTPIKFLTSGIALIVVLLVSMDSGLFEQHGLADKTLMAKYLLVICLTTPLTIPFVALVLRIGLSIISALPGVSTSIKNDRMAANLVLPISPSTYARLDYSHFLWCIFYFGVYFYVSLQLYLVVSYLVVTFGGALVGAIAAHLDKCLSDVDDLVRLSNNMLPPEKTAEYLALCRASQPPSNSTNVLLAQMFFAGIGGVIIFLGYGMLINPYVILLRSTVKIPTKRMHRSDCAPASAIITTIAGRKGKKSMFDKVQIKQLTGIVDTWEKRTVPLQDRRAAAFGPAYLSRLHDERAAIYSRMLDTPALRNVLANSSLPEDIREKIAGLTDRIDALREAKRPVSSQEAGMADPSAS